MGLICMSGVLSHFRCLSLVSLKMVFPFASCTSSVYISLIPVILVSVFIIGFAGTDTTFTCKVLLCSFLCKSRRYSSSKTGSHRWILNLVNSISNSRASIFRHGRVLHSIKVLSHGKSSHKLVLSDHLASPVVPSRLVRESGFFLPLTNFQRQSLQISDYIVGCWGSDHLVGRSCSRP